MMMMMMMMMMYLHTQAKVIRLGQHLEYTTIEDLTLKSEIIYDPDPKTTVVCMCVCIYVCMW